MLISWALPSSRFYKFLVIPYIYYKKFQSLMHLACMLPKCRSRNCFLNESTVFGQHPSCARSLYTKKDVIYYLTTSTPAIQIKPILKGTFYPKIHKTRDE